jgi:hypothetical protein
MRKMSVVIVTSLLFASLPAWGQGPDSAVYRVEFNIHDGSDAAAKAGRHYTMLIEANGKGVFKAGSKVPYATGSFQPGAGSPQVATQYNYAEVGVNIDAYLKEVNGRVSLNAMLDLSTLVQPDKGAAMTPPTPTIAQLRVQINAALTPGKPTQVAAIDDPVTMRKFEVEATITKVN